MSPGPSALSPQEEQPGPSRARRCRAQMGSGLGENKGELWGGKDTVLWDIR